MSSFSEQELQGGGVIAMETPKHTRIKSYGKIIPLIQCSRSIPNITDKLKCNFEKYKAKNTTTRDGEEESLKNKSSSMKQEKLVY